MTRPTPQHRDIPSQSQIGSEPGFQAPMTPQPESTALPVPTPHSEAESKLSEYKGSGKLEEKVVLVTGGEYSM